MWGKIFRLTLFCLLAALKIREFFHSAKEKWKGAEWGIEKTESSDADMLTFRWICLERWCIYESGARQKDPDGSIDLETIQI